RHHHAGLMQTDLYLKNFLVEGDRMFTLDGDAIKPLPRFFTNRAALGNLAVLLSKFDVLGIQQWLDTLLVAYAEARGWQKPIDTKRMQALIMRHRHRAVDGYANKKVFRQCTDVTVSRSWGHFLAISQNSYSKELEQILLNAPDALIDGPGCQRLKSGKTCTVSMTEINDRKMVVKRYNIKSFWHGLGRLWRPSRAAASWANAHRLLMYGIATAAPVALLETRFGPLRGKAFFLAEYVQAPNIADLMQDVLLDQDQKRSAVQALAALMYKLSLLQIVHGDLKASNIHIDGSQPVLIDLDSLYQCGCKARFEAGHVRDLKRLLRNWQDQPEVRQWLIAALQKVYGNHPLLAKALKLSAIKK
ncbi:MAG: lipopolysaccharide kinase InaA family protein, partial [Nitrosomonadales bacterium]|nr:lipopolysaccharide kinase InaA family protein [Nitrosomonadales bacterium]